MSTEHIAAVSFDLDGTLCRYTRPGTDVLSAAYRDVGVEPFASFADYAASIDDHADCVSSVDALRRRCFAELAQQQGIDADVGYAVADAYSAIRDQSAVTWEPGAEEAFATLSDDYPMAIVTNGYPAQQRKKLRALGIDETVDVVIYAGTDVPRKPSPEPLTLAAKRLDVAVDEVIHIGNNLEHDVGCANAAGSPNVWIPGPHDWKQLDGTIPTYVAGSPQALLPPPWEPVDH